MNDQREKEYWLDKIKEIIKDYADGPEMTTLELEQRLTVSALDIFDHIEIAVLKDQLQQLTDKISKKLYS